MTKDEFIYERARECLERLKACQKNDDRESAHANADKALLTFISAIGFSDIKFEYDEIVKWYA